MKTFYLLLMALFLSTASRSTAQSLDSLLNAVDSTGSGATVDAVFKSTRIVLSHSSETQKKHDLDMRIRHHFGDIGGRFGSAHTLYGLDIASDLFIGFDYGFSDHLTLGIGRSKQQEMYNFSGKYRLIKQSRVASMPLNLTLFAQMGWIAREPLSDREFDSYADRFSYFLQAILSRKFSSRFSLQAMPGYLIRNQISGSNGSASLVTLGFAGRMKLSKRLSFVADYTLVEGLSKSNSLPVEYYNPLGVGLEIETGGHIFSLNFMNAEYILENNFLAQSQKSWGRGGVRFGFTISRNFTLFKSKNKGPDQQSIIH